MIPNLISVLRIILVVPIVLCMLKNDFKMAAVFLFFAGVTDFLDGFFARKLNQETNIGAMLDPIADKILVFVLLVVFSAINMLPVWFCGILILRDVLILCGGWYLLKVKNIQEMPPVMVSKINTVFILTLFMDIFLLLLFPCDLFLRIKESFMLIATMTTIFSFAVYYRRFWELCKK